VVVRGGGGDTFNTGAACKTAHRGRCTDGHVSGDEGDVNDKRFVPHTPATQGAVSLGGRLPKNLPRPILKWSSIRMLQVKDVKIK
jgi:hypothetical protein